MDPSRQIRILIPPFFLFVALIWAVFDSYTSNEIRSFFDGLGLSGWEIIAFFLGAIGLATLPIGYIISTITTLIMDCWSRNCRGSIFQSDIDTELISDLRKALDPTIKDNEVKPKEMLEALVAFDHGILNKIAPGTHEWLARVYSWQVISSISIAALLISMIIVLLIFSLNPTFWWWCTSSVLILVLFLGYRMSKRDNTHVTEFQLKLWLEQRENYYQFHCENELTKSQS